jgi:hypothetical protein
MKKLLSSLFILAALGFVACNNEKKDDKADADGKEKIETPAAPASPAGLTAAVAHVCTDACKDGNHSYAHGDVGHTCTEACGAAHVCTDNCAGGATHVYAHGEAGHTCTEDCMKM